MDPITIAIGLANAAPAILGWLKGDKAAAAAQKVLDIAKTVTGKSDPAEAATAIAVNPGDSEAFRTAIAVQQTDLDKAYLADTADARARDEVIVKSGKTNYRADVMVILAVLGVLSCLFSLCYFHGELPEGASTLITTIASLFGTCLIQAFNFEFGSSRDSATQQAALADAIAKK